MYQLLLSAMIVFMATLIGATTGIGGGVIIKPLMDAFQLFSLSALSLYSSCAVFTMSIVAIIKSIHHKVQINKHRALLLSISALGGGKLGEVLLLKVMEQMREQAIVRIQSFLLMMTFLMILIYFFRYQKKLHFKSESKTMMIGLGIFLGTYSVFLGIGGGPINIMLLVVLFSLNAKDSAIYSLIIIFFSQIPKIFSFIGNIQTTAVQYDVLAVILIASIIGGYMGAHLNHKLNESMIRFIYSGVLVILMALSIWNFCHSF